MGQRGTERPQHKNARMSHVRLSARANSDLVRLYEFLAQYDVATADRAIATIIAAFDILEAMPLGSPLVAGRKDIRKLVINFGASGYVAFYGVAGYTYAYDGMSRPTSINSTFEGVSTFTYDATSQLTGADHTSQTDETYGFDANGNRNTTGFTGQIVAE